MAKNGKGKGRKVRQSTGGRVPSGVRYSGRDMRRYPSSSRDDRRGVFVSHGSRKSGWFGDHRRHVLAGKGISTVLPDGRRLDVSRFVAGGFYKKMSRGESQAFALDKAEVLYDNLLLFKKGEMSLQDWIYAVNQFERKTVNRGLDSYVESGANTLYEYLVTETYDGVDDDYVLRSSARINMFKEQYTSDSPDEDYVEMEHSIIMKLRRRK